MTHKHTSYPAENIPPTDDLSPREIIKEIYRSGSAVAQNKALNINPNGAPMTPGGSNPKNGVKNKSAKKRLKDQILANNTNVNNSN